MALPWVLSEIPFSVSRTGFNRGAHWPWCLSTPYSPLTTESHLTSLGAALFADKGLTFSEAARGLAPTNKRT
jgi:hypothetical protein